MPGKTRRVKIRELPKTFIYNVSKKFRLPPKKTYNKYRGKEFELYGYHRPTGKYVLNTGNGDGIFVDPENIEFPENNHNIPCARCGRNPAKHLENTMFNRMDKVTKGRNMNPKLYVEQNNFQINNNGKPLYTYGLATCTALGFKLGTKQFLAHVSTGTDVEKIIKSVKSHKKIPTDVKVWTGVGDSLNSDFHLNNPSGRSLKLVYKITDALGINRTDIEFEDVCFAEIVP